MSTHSRAVTLARDLIRCASVTPVEGGALALIEALLKPYGFDVHRVTFSEPGTPDVENLYARIGEGANLCFAGHTDVVPAGDEAAWSHGPFSGDITGDTLWGRGACDMKGGVAASIAAVLDHIDAHGVPKAHALSFLITGDEEGPAVNGTVKLLEWAKARGERFDASILGEPTNPDIMGSMMKIGRRGSLSGDIEVNGVQGHVAYQHLAKNPIDGMMRLLGVLKTTPLDAGTPHFLPTNLEITSVDVGNRARNVIPGRAKAEFNVRFNDLWTSATLGAEIRRRLATVNDAPDFTLTLHPSNAEAFLTAPGAFVSLMSRAVHEITGRTPDLSTTGGTSDARFITHYCPVIEFGLVGQTMHKVDEQTSISDIDVLTRIYRRAIELYVG